MITAGELENFMKKNKIKPTDGIIFIDIGESDTVDDLVIYKDLKYDKFKLLSKVMET